MQKMGQIIGQEARALGVTQLFAPLADLARELRYGRVCLTRQKRAQDSSANEWVYRLKKRTPKTRILPERSPTITSRDYKVKMCLPQSSITWDSAIPSKD